MQRVLRLNMSGTPTHWLSRHDAATLYVKNQVKWEVGQKRMVLLGGHNHHGIQSSIEISPVIATRGSARVSKNLSVSFNNRMLFRRDNYRCMYCGARHMQSTLTRDHVLPRSRGGKDTWENVVAACQRCNHYKADRTPEEAGMALLAIPFRPNVFETMYLSQHTILEDQMEYLEKQFSGRRAWKVM